jgi:outer membrane protein TolC
MTILRIVVACIALAACPVLPALAAEDSVLALAEAERLAVESAPGLARQRSQTAAAAERSVHEGRLPDPQLSLGAINVPTDSFRLDAEDMTMLMVGVRQSFPAGDTRRFQSERAQHELSREQARLEAEHRSLVKQVRQAWLGLFLLHAEQQASERMRPLVTSQREAAEGRYRAGADPHQKVLQARQMLARLTDREYEIRARTARARAQLARWIGDAAFRPLPETLPLLPEAVPFDVDRHPEVQASKAMTGAAHADAAITREERKPAMMLDLSYGARQNRPDMMSAVLTLDMPLFPGKRQDRRLAEKLALENASQFEGEDKRRELAAMYRAVRAETEALDARTRLYAGSLLPDATREAQVTVAGFARDQSEFREARLRAIDIALDLTRLEVERARAQSELLYLTGESQP